LHRQSVVLNTSDDVCDVAVLDYDRRVVGLIAVIETNVVIDPGNRVFILRTKQE